MKHFKGIGILLVAMLMACLFAVPALAEELTEVRTTTFTDTFKAAAGTSTKNLPAASFQYSIAAGPSRDASYDPVTGTATPAITAGVVSAAGPSIGSASHAATASGTTSDSVTVTVDFTDVTFTQGGIYRYVITEGAVTSNVSADITKDTRQDNANKGSYYLDVYVNKVGDEFVPTAYMMSAKDSSFTIDNNGSVAYDGEKITGITNEYKTYDLTITKHITGNVVSSSFAFTINISGLYADVAIQQDNQTVKSGSTSYQFTADLEDGASTVIKGLPSTALYQVYEAVDRLMGYEVSVKVDGTADSTNFVWGASGSDTENQEQSFGMKAASATAMGTANKSIEFTNNLASISPTGLVLRVAPYALAVGAGVAFFVISRRRKEEVA